MFALIVVNCKRYNSKESVATQPRVRQAQTAATQARIHSDFTDSQYAPYMCMEPTVARGFIPTLVVMVS